MLSFIVWWFAVSVALGIIAGKCMYAMGAGLDASRCASRHGGQVHETVRSALSA
jgi:hypothetical protein